MSTEHVHTNPLTGWLYGTAAAFAASNPHLKPGQGGVETDSGKTKAGTGARWADTAYTGGSGGGGLTPPTAGVYVNDVNTVGQGFTLVNWQAAHKPTGTGFDNQSGIVLTVGGYQWYTAGDSGRMAYRSQNGGAWTNQWLDCVTGQWAGGA